MIQSISHSRLLELADEWLRAGKRVIGPAAARQDLCLYAPIVASGQLVLDGVVHPANSIKEIFFPRHESIYRYRFKGQALELEDCEPPAAGQVVLGARPCDAAALPILDEVFTWDVPDKFYCQRREATTVVTVACAAWDDDCFCTSVGLGPAAEQGSDALLLPGGGGRYEVRCLTAKGEALFAGKTEPAEAAAPVPEGPPRRFELDALQAFLRGEYEHPAWKEAALRCLGCGACAYTCPTCHCFDIVDEGQGAEGVRARNWDSCQFAMFTAHASGHNPRTTQGQRQRQRIQHKFRIYPDKFGRILCTGCGNCARNCPVGLGVPNTIDEVLRIPVRDASEVD